MKRILKFYSEHCGPCKVMSKNLAELKNVEIQEVDVTDEANFELLETYNIRSIPTVVVLTEEGELITSFTGVTPVETIQAVIDGGQTATA